MMHMAVVFVGGGLGAAARFTLSRFISQHAFAAVPLGTLAENIGGAVLIGFFFELFEIAAIPFLLRSFITIGFIGGFTTFSTYALETVLLLQRREYAAASINFMLHNVVGFVAVVVGILAADALSAAISGGFHA